MAFHRAGIGVAGAYPYPAAALPSNGVDNFSGELRRWRRLPTVLCMKGECVRTFVQRRVERSKKGRAVEVEAERKLVRLRLVTVAEKRLSPSSERERAEP
jgi:hypothetical protein